MKDFKFDRVLLDQANTKLYKLIQKVIDTKRRPSDGKKLKKRTGNLRTKIKPLLKVRGNVLEIDIKVMEYYKYLDEGTKRIEPWFLTKEITESQEFDDIINELITKSGAAWIRSSMYQILSDVKP